MSCDKGYTWNPSTCTCEYDMWCKSGRYLDHKNCVCKYKLVGRIIAECTSAINETMINNNNKNVDNNTTFIFISLYSVLLFTVITCFCIFIYFKWFKGKTFFKKYTNYWNYGKA